MYSDLFLGINTTNGDLDGLLSDLSNHIKLSNPKKMKLKRAIQKLQQQQTGTPPVVTPNTSTSTSKLTPTTGIHAMTYITPTDIQLIDNITNYIKLLELRYDQLINHSSQIEENATHCNKLICNCFENIIQFVNQRKNALLQDLKNIESKKKHLMQESIVQIEKHIEFSQQCKKDSNKLIHKPISIDELTNRSQTIEQNIDKCMNEKGGKDLNGSILSKSVSNQTFVTDSQINFDKNRYRHLLTSISIFGELSTIGAVDGVEFSRLRNQRKKENHDHVTTRRRIANGKDENKRHKTNKNKIKKHDNSQNINKLNIDEMMQNLDELNLIQFEKLLKSDDWSESEESIFSKCVQWAKGRDKSNNTVVENINVGDMKMDEKEKKELEENVNPDENIVNVVSGFDNISNVKMRYLDYLKILKDDIRFPLMSSQYFTKKVLTIDGLLTIQEKVDLTDYFLRRQFGIPSVAYKTVLNHKQRNYFSQFRNSLQVK